MGAARPLHRSGRQGRHPLEELHRRVRELRDRAVVGLLVALLVGLVTASTTARADEPITVDAIARLGRQLLADSRDERQEAFEALGALPESALPAVRERLVALRQSRPTPEVATEILTQIRRATGSRRADDLVDVADGVPTFLGERRDGDAQRIVEPLLLMRSLERIGTTEALGTIPEVLRLDRGAWTMEGRRSTLRLGDRAAAAIIRARAHEDPAGREWARWSGRELALDDPGRLVQRLSPPDLAEVLLAWGATRSIDAMPVVASFVDDHRRFVRDAARTALHGYGQNGIWQAREQFRLRLGEDASLQWGWERTLRELTRRLDEQRMARVQEFETQAEAAISAGNPEAASRALETLLARAPDAASPEIAARFAHVGDLFGFGRRSQARTAYERALRLAPTHPEAALWRARLTYFAAEDALDRGVLDVDAFLRAAEGDPSCEPCAARAASVTAQMAPPPEDDAEERRRQALGGSAVLFALLGLGLLWPRRRRVAPPPEADAPPAVDEPSDDDSLDGPLLGHADATLPG